MTQTSTAPDSHVGSLLSLRSPQGLVHCRQEGGEKSCRVEAGRGAPVWAQPRSAEAPAAAQPCCLQEHRQSSPRSASDRRPEDTQRGHDVLGQAQGRGQGGHLWALPQGTDMPRPYLGNVRFLGAHRVYNYLECACVQTHVGLHTESMYIRIHIWACLCMYVHGVSACVCAQDMCTHKPHMCTHTETHPPLRVSMQATCEPAPAEPCTLHNLLSIAKPCPPILQSTEQWRTDQPQR